MLRNTLLKSFFNVAKSPKCEISGVINSSCQFGDTTPLFCQLCKKLSRITAQGIHTSPLRMGGEDRKQLAATMPKKDEGAEGEKSIDIDTLIKSKDDMFPDAQLPNRLFDGVPFKDLPVIDIKSTKNNTQLTVMEWSGNAGVVKLHRTCGMEGFKHTRKGTNIAAQATAIAFSTRILNAGYKTVRVRVQGLGPGRMSAIKGLQMGGIQVVSVTDSTRVSWCPPRPRKQRRL